MIKFIATDLDGTLLDDGKRLPAQVFGLIRQLQEKGVLFAPASGRQYANLKQLFLPVWENLVFICENGALVKYREKTLYRDPIPVEKVRAALGEIRAVGGLYPMLCAEDCAYIESEEEPFFTYAKLSYTNCKRLERLEEALDRENICKIAVYDLQPSAEHCYPLLNKALSPLRTVVSSYDWCDITSPTANKGRAIEFLRENFGLEREECAAFGDHMNDYEMLLACGQPYITENAYPGLKREFENVIPSNNEGGVLQKLKELLEEL